MLYCTCVCPCSKIRPDHALDPGRTLCSNNRHPTRKFTHTAKRGGRNMGAVEHLRSVVILFGDTANERIIVPCSIFILRELLTICAPLSTGCSMLPPQQTDKVVTLVRSVTTFPYKSKLPSANVP